MVMLLLVLGAFIFGVFILAAILALIYVLWELFNEAMGDDAVERKPRVEEPLDREERLINHGISSEYDDYPCKKSVADDGTIRVEPNPVSDIIVTMENSCQPLCDTRISCEESRLPEAAKRGHFTSAFNAVEEFVFGANTFSDSD